MLSRKFFAALTFIALFLNFAAYVSAKELDLDDWVKLNFKGIEHANKGNYKKALDNFNKALKIDLSNLPELTGNSAIYINESTLLTNMGTTYLRMNDTDKALEYLNRAVEANADFAPAYNARGAVYYKLADYEKAILDFDKAVEIDSTYEEALTNLRNACIKSGDVSAGVWNGLGAAFFKIGEYKTAVECFDKVIEVSPDNVTVWGNRGAAYYNLKNYSMAIKNFQKVLELKPYDIVALSSIGFGYFNLEKYDRAVQFSQMVLAQEGNNKPALMNLGNSYLKLGDTDKAAECFRKIIELNPKSAVAWYNLSKIYFDTGDFENAADCGEKAVALDENYEDAWKLLANIYTKLNYSEKAAKAQAGATVAALNNVSARVNFAGRALRNATSNYILGSVTDG